MATAIADVSIARKSHWCKEKGETVHFTVNSTLPRVGNVNIEYRAERSVVHNTNGQEMSPWSIRRNWSAPLPNGVGEKTLDLLEPHAERVITEWLASDAYTQSRAKALATYIAGEVRDHRFGYDNAAKLLAKHRNEMDPLDGNRIEAALTAFQHGNKLLAEVFESE